MSIYDKPSREMLLDAINKQNGLTETPLSWQQIAAGYPELVTTPGANKNTRVLLYGLNGLGYKGNVTITYDRIDMPTLFRNVVPIVITDPVTKLSDLLPFINKKYGLSLIEDDIVEQNVSSLGESWILDVSVKAGCLAWKGDFRLRYAKFFPNLADVVTDVDLSAIIAPWEVGTKPQAEYVAYGYDWTDLKTTFEVDWPFGRAITAADVDLLNEIVPLGFTFASPANAKPDEVSLLGAQFLGTQAVIAKSEFDVSYQRVTTIKLAATSNYAGNLILHYSPV